MFIPLQKPDEEGDYIIDRRLGLFNDVAEIFNTSDTNQIIGITNHFPTTPLPNRQPNQQPQFPQMQQLQQQQQQQLQSLQRQTAQPPVATSSLINPTSFGGSTFNGLINQQSINNNYPNNQSIRALNNNSSKSNNNIHSNSTINNVNNYTKPTFPLAPPPPSRNISSCNANISNNPMNNGGSLAASGNVNSSTFLRPSSEKQQQPRPFTNGGYQASSASSVQSNKHEVSKNATRNFSSSLLHFS